jgi:hypothetical protein
MANDTVTAVETAVKTDVTSELTKLKALYVADLAKAKAELVKLEAETFTGKTLAIVAVVSFVVGGLLAHFL